MNFFAKFNVSHSIKSKRGVAYQFHMASAGDGDDAAAPCPGTDSESYPLHVDYCGGDCLYVFVAELVNM